MVLGVYRRKTGCCNGVSNPPHDLQKPNIVVTGLPILGYEGTLRNLAVRISATDACGPYL